MHEQVNVARDWQQGARSLSGYRVRRLRSLITPISEGTLEDRSSGDGVVGPVERALSL